MKRAFLLLGVLGLVGCSQSTETKAQKQIDISTAIFSDSNTQLKIEVVFEAGAEPYVGNIGLTTQQTWSITRSSYEALFQNHVGRIITVPTVLSDMAPIADQGRSNWTAEELIKLGQSVAPGLKVNSVVNVTVIFVNGLYMSNSSVLGVHFAGYPFAFVFKDVVVSVGGSSVQQRYVEQGTAVHELGHVVGLVNNGVPMQAGHEDGSHAKHTANSQCVMYWAVESTSTILSSLNGLILGSQLNLFGPETLADGRAFHP